MRLQTRVICRLLLALCLLSASASYAAEEKLPKLLDLGAKKCIPCKMMAPILKELTREYAGVFDVEFIDVWQKENAEKAKAYGIKQIPTQIFLAADGKEIWRHVGFISKEDILKKWKALGYEFAPVTAADITKENSKPAPPAVEPED